ncbi:MAG: IS110 family transposase [Chloroflexota bacterium]|nr:MAG: IS110 family transposase [Chloroflexota bacterium]
MTQSHPPTRYIGLDIHKHYMVAIGVDQDQRQVFGPHKVKWGEFEDWMKKHLNKEDAVVLEMTTNTWEVHDLLVEQVGSVTVVHPPHVKLIVRAQAMTDGKAALVLAQLHAAGLLPGIWVPPQDVRDLRALVAQRDKMRRISSVAKNRLQNALHRNHIIPPKGHAFAAKNRAFWEGLELPPVEKSILMSDLETMDFAEDQKKSLEKELGKLAAEDERVPLLVQIPGIGLINAMAILAAIGDISRFPSAKKLVGYAGLYPRFHQSGLSYTTGRLVSYGRRDLRWAMVEAALSASQHSPHWKKIRKSLAPRIGSKKALIAIARKLLIAVWHILNEKMTDKYAVPEKVAATFFALAYRIGVKNLPDGMSALEFTRHNLDRMGIGENLTRLRWGSKTFSLPPSSLKVKQD